MQATTWLLISLLLGTLVSCAPESEWTDLRGSATDCIIAVFPQGTSMQAINEFLEEHTQGAPHPGGGHRLRSGIGAVINMSIGDQDAYQICFKPGADRAQVNTIRNEIEASRLVERVLEGENADQGVSRKQ
jgi:hypothetical protein